MAVDSAGKGQVITFYSYKGGTGRTMALANIAFILASNGKRVLAADWDLESPGLHKFFHPFLDESAIQATPGVIEIISDYAWAAVSHESRPEDWYLEYAQVLRHAVSLAWEFPGGGVLDFLSAGRHNRDYSSAVSALDWDNFYDRLGGGRFFRAMRENMKANYDYVLIDSRTGLSDLADICTIEFPDTLVVCFTMNDQSMDGGSAVARQITARYRDRDIRVLPVPMRIEDGEKEKVDIGRALARARFDGLPAGLTAEESARYWGTLEVPYKPFYAFEEMLATFGDDPGSPTSLLAAFERVTDVITGGQVTAMPPLDNGLRQLYREAFARRRPSSLADVYLSYAPEDRMWADWAESVLAHAGYRVLPRSTATAGDDRDSIVAWDTLEPAPRMIALVSASYMRYPAAREIWDVASAADPRGARRQFISMRVSEVRLTAPFDDRAPVDLTRLDAEQAATALLRAVARPVEFHSRSAPSAGDEPRFPRRVPAVWNVPSRNAAFTGRAVNLENLRDRLAGAGAVSLAQALYGLGGVGKTQLALEYAHRFMADYDLVWWVPAADTEQIVAAMAELAARLGINAPATGPEAAKAVQESLRRGDATGRWLLIFDDADDPKELEPYLPAGPGHVLITSRNQAWTLLAEPLEVDVFTREESTANLMLHVPGLDPEEADRVAETLGDLPVAVEQAGAWLRETGMQAAMYVEQPETQTTRMLERAQPSDYPIPAVTTWNLSLERLGQRSPASVRLLQLCAFFAPGPISMTLLYSDEMVASLAGFDESLTEKLMLGRVIRDISRYSLIKVDQGNNCIQIHPLVQNVIRSQLASEEQAAACHEIHAILVAARPRSGDADDPENWPRFEQIWPHLVPSRADESTDEKARHLFIDQVRYLWLRGESEAGLQLARWLESRWVLTLGTHHRQVLQLRSNRTKRRRRVFCGM